MRAYDVIEKKRDNKELTEKEIEYFVNGYISGEIVDYQMSAFLMAVYFNGMTDSECEALTRCMLNSGEIMDLSSVEGVKVDKHSTGGVGDKTTLIVTPIVAACGVKVAKMSGRGLGHTGGTVDKLDSIPGMNVELPRNKFFEMVNNIGCSIVSQSGNLVPADKKMYMLRDVTATVESMPLIASSIMSKKLASGANCILLDVKVGSGAFMKSKQDAIKLSHIMVNIGKRFGRKVVAVVTDMNRPLGNAIGNALEVRESCEVLQGGGPDDLKAVCIYLASNMLSMAGMGPSKKCDEMVEKVINSGEALKKFEQMVSAQGGDLSSFEGNNYKNASKIEHKVFANVDGYIGSMDTQMLGKAAMTLGAGREKKEDTIDYNAGIILNRKTGDKVNCGDLLATFYTSDVYKCNESEKIFMDALTFENAPPKNLPLIYAKVMADNKVENY